MMADTSGAAQRYEVLAQDRQPFLTRARTASKLTIPALIPEQGHNASSELYRPYQSVGARGVNNLAGKMLMALLPPTSVFFRLLVDEKVLTDIAEKATQSGENVDQVIADMDVALGRVERSVLREIEKLGIRKDAFEAFKHLIVSGNVLLFVPPAAKVGSRVFPLHQYVVDRDPEGTVLEIMVKEEVAPDVLPAENNFRKQIIEDLAKFGTAGQTPIRTVDLYTHVKREGDKYHVEQTVKGKVVPGSTGTFAAEKLPWLALRWIKIDGESYGRGHVEEYIGDLAALEELSKAILEAAAIAAHCIYLVNPNSLTDPMDLQKTPNGGFTSGVAEDVGALRQDKYADLSFASNEASKIEFRLSHAFLLHTAVQRDAERVTAEEIRYVANELENSLGGVYSVQASEFQLPLVTLVFARLQTRGVLPNLPDEAVYPTIVTGLDALGRSQELLRIRDSILIMKEAFGDAAMTYAKVDRLWSRVFTAQGIENADDLIRSEEEVQQMQQAAQQAALVEKAAPNVVNAVNDQMTNAQQQPNG